MFGYRAFNTVSYPKEIPHNSQIYRAASGYVSVLSLCLCFFFVKGNEGGMYTNSCRAALKVLETICINFISKKKKL